MTTTADQGIVVPDPDAVNNVPTDLITLLEGIGGTSGGVNDGLESRLLKRYLTAADRTTRNPSPKTGEVSFLLDTKTYWFYTGSVWTPLVRQVDTLTYTTNGTVASSTGVETAVPANWGSPNGVAASHLFLANTLYAVEVSGGFYDSGSTTCQGELLVRRGAGGTGGNIIAFWRQNTIAGIGALVPDFYFKGYAKNTTGADITDTLALTVKRITGVSTVNLYGDANAPLQITTTPIGLIADKPNIAAIARTIA